MSVWSSLFGRQRPNVNKHHGKNKHVLVIGNDRFFNALIPSLPKSGSWTVTRMEEIDMESFPEEAMDLIMYTYPKAGQTLEDEPVEMMVSRRVFALMDLLEHLRAQPPRQFIFLSSSRAGEPDSVFGALYRNGEVLVEGFGRATGSIAKNLRRMSTSVTILEQLKSREKAIQATLTHWLDEQVPTGTYDMAFDHEAMEVRLHRLDAPSTDYLIAKKIISNMKRYFASGQTREGLQYLKQLHIRKESE